MALHEFAKKSDDVRFHACQYAERRTEFVAFPPHPALSLRERGKRRPVVVKLWLAVAVCRRGMKDVLRGADAANENAAIRAVGHFCGL